MRSRFSLFTLLLVASCTSSSDSTSAASANEGGEGTASSSDGSGSIGGSIGGSSGGAAGTSVADDSTGADTISGSTDDGSETPVEVQDCESLPAPGVWEEISMPPRGGEEIRSAALRANPTSHGTVFFGTETSDGLFRTDDCGATFEHISYGRNSELLNSGGQWTMHMTVNGALFANSGYGHNGLFRSTNGGVDWDVVWPPADPALADIVSYNFAGAVYPDPYDPDRFLLSFHAPCNGVHGPGCVAETTDAGDTWRIISNTANPFSSEVRSYVLDSDRWLFPSQGDLWLTEDAGLSFSNVATASAGGHSAGDMLRTENGFFLGSPTGVLRSTDGIDWAVVPGTGSWIKGVIQAEDLVVISTNGGIMTSPLADGDTWTLLPDSPVHTDGCFLDYDPSHQLLWASCMAGGLWRFVMSPS